MWSHTEVICILIESGHPVIHMFKEGRMRNQEFLNDVCVGHECFFAQTHLLEIRFIMWNCTQVTATEHLWWVKIGSDNGLMPSGNKPLP